MLARVRVDRETDIVELILLSRVLLESVEGQKRMMERDKKQDEEG